MIGPIVPVPAPRAVMEALNDVTVTNTDEGRGGFQLTFALSTQSPLHTLFLLGSGMSSMPVIRVVIIATVNGTPNVIMDGAMTKFDIAPGSKSSQATLTVTGEDLSIFLDQGDLSGLPFPAMPAEGRVALLLAKYAMLGIVPLPTSKIEAQEGTDLAYITALAERVGYVFYIDPGPLPGQSIGYWGPQIKIGVPQPALNVDMDALTNVESLSFSFDPTKGVLPVVFIQNQLTRVPIPIPIPNLNPLQPPLGALPTPISNIKLLKDTAKMNPMQAISKGLAEAKRSQDSVSAHGTLNVLHYGRPLKARQLVGVRGAGIAYDGLYYVQSVTSTLKRGEFKQSFELTRNGLISITPRVPV